MSSSKLIFFLRRPPNEGARALWRAPSGRCTRVGALIGPRASGYSPGPLFPAPLLFPSTLQRTKKNFCLSARRNKATDRRHPHGNGRVSQCPGVNNCTTPRHPGARHAPEYPGSSIGRPVFSSTDSSNGNIGGRFEIKEPPAQSHTTR